MKYNSCVFFFIFKDHTTLLTFWISLQYDMVHIIKQSLFGFSYRTRMM